MKISKNCKIEFCCLRLRIEENKVWTCLITNWSGMIHFQIYFSQKWSIFGKNLILRLSLILKCSWKYACQIFKVEAFLGNEAWNEKMLYRRFSYFFSRRITPSPVVPRIQPYPVYPCFRTMKIATASNETLVTVSRGSEVLRNNLMSFSDVSACNNEKLLPWRVVVSV